MAYYICDWCGKMFKDGDCVNVCPGQGMFHATFFGAQLPDLRECSVKALEEYGVPKQGSIALILCKDNFYEPGSVDMSDVENALADSGQEGQRITNIASLANKFGKKYQVVGQGKKVKVLPE